MLPTWLSFPLLLPYRINVGSLSSLIPYSVNGPFKRTLMTLFRLAWSNKLQLPILITVCFMAFDIRLQLEINIFWEANHQNGRNRQANVNAQVIVPPPTGGTHADEGDNNSVNESDDEEETDSDESELHSLKDNNDSDDSGDEGGESERPNPQSRFFSDSDHNFSDRNSNGESEDSDGNGGNPPIVVEVEIHRANNPLVHQEDINKCHGLSKQIELNRLRYNYVNGRENSEINIFDTERRQILYKVFASSTTKNVSKQVLPVPLLFEEKLLPNILNAQNCLKRTNIYCVHNPAKNFSSCSASNFLSSIRSKH